jgi:hypothetical protein
MSEGTETGPEGETGRGTATTGQPYPPAPQGGQHGGTGNQNVNISGTGNQVAGRDIRTKHVTRNGRTVPVIGSLSIGGKVVAGTLAAAAAVGTGIAIHTSSSGTAGSGVIALPASVEGYARIAAPATPDPGQVGLTVEDFANDGILHPQLAEYGQAFTAINNHGWDVVIGGDTTSFNSTEVSNNEGSNEAVAPGFGGTEYCSDGTSSADGQGPPSCVWWNSTNVIMVSGPGGDDASQVAAVLARIHDGTEK